ncbi:hypothetical protein I316_06962 [Kwoniella heveanensis BCC8398]|uniref:GPI inositol-deacylase n=1 Tax=Kwoniella heveanensis BCC8398 TaxID=1296120 RepID=A0A1B9GK37_9TREE|nr:hypothetical protein I316_06962 [Kwoniella heveanensis BCC8398]
MKSPTASSSLSTPSSRAYSASRVPITNGILSVIALFLSWILYQAYTYDNAQSGAWGCEMSWMTPSYRMIDWKDNPVPRYTLHLYRELGWDNDGQVTGHPVLFIPGNAGSYQQVRSIASSAARQYYGEPGGKAAHGMQSMRSIDLFTGAYSTIQDPIDHSSFHPLADLNEEFSAFHAPTLREQARFIASCIHKIFAQYRHLPPADRPTKITLLGHSMGGIVARLAVTSQTVSAIDAILTMSTPHAIPPLTLDSDMDSIYRTINKGQNKNDDHPTLISLCGGVSDTQIVSDSCGVLPSFVSDGFAAFTTNMPHVWTGVDHQAMVWCHQVRWRVARTLLEMTRSVSRHDKLQTAKQWLLLDNNAAASASADVLSEIERIIPVTSRSMTILLSETVGASYRVQHCESGGRCRIQTPVQEYLPLPANKTAPFPLSGEGIKAGESLIAVKVDLESEHGYLLLHSSSTLDRLDHGSRSQVNVSGSAWSPPPIIKHVTIPSRQTSHEARYFPHYDNPQVIRIHSHISSAPFISGHADSMGIQLELFQSTDCPVTTVKISVEWLGTLAKIVTRYRMTVVAWTIGWAAIVMLKQMSILRQTGESGTSGASAGAQELTWILLPPQTDS